MRGGPVYIVKPKYIFKHPFNKYDLSTPTNREMQNQELTDYFNYGFNQDTMNIYGKLVKRFIEVLDHRKNLQYFNEPSLLMRLNDEIPMDFGGFCKFHDPSIINTDTSEDFDDGAKLMQYFIMMIFVKSQKMQYPLIEFIKSMYRGEEVQKNQDDLFDIIQQIGKNIQKKYQETMKKLIQKSNQVKPVQSMHKRNQQVAAIQKQQNRQVIKVQIKKQKKEQEISASDSDHDSGSDDSDDSKDKVKRKKSKQKDRKSQMKSKKKDHEKDRGDRKKKDSKDKDRKSSKQKKIKKQKHRKRSRSRDKSRQKNRDKSRQRSRDKKKKNH